MKNIKPNKCGKRIKLQREKLGITQAQLARILKWDFTLLSHYERGARFPKVDKLYHLSQALNCSIPYLLGEGADETEVES